MYMCNELIVVIMCVYVCIYIYIYIYIYIHTYIYVQGLAEQLRPIGPVDGLKGMPGKPACSHFTN